MKKNSYKLSILTVLLATASFVYFTGCTDKGAPSLYQDVPTGPIGATPAITSVDPASSALAGVTTITITGQNFSSDSASVFVYFNGQPGTLLSASPTQLTVVSPNIVGPVKLKVATLSAELFSNEISYQLNAAAKDVFPDSKSTFVLPYGITSDKEGDIFMSVYNGGNKGVKEITPDSTITDWALPGAETYWNSMRFGSDGTLYGARNVRAVFSMTQGGSPATYVVLPSGTFITQLEFDPSGNLWAAGKGGIYKIDPLKVATKFDYAPEVTAMRIFKDGSTVYLYVAGYENNAAKIQRFAIDNLGNLGSAEDVYDFSAKYGQNYRVTALDFTADGDMILGTDSPTPIVIVHTDNSAEALYPSVLVDGAVFNFTWGKPGDPYLYYTRVQTLDPATSAVVNPQKLVRLNIQKPGAPIY